MAEKNFILFSIDDLRSIDDWDHFRDLVVTPNTERLMDAGVTFTRAVTQTPLCNPSRAAVLSGKQPSETGVLDNSTDWFSRIDAAETLPAVLKAAGVHVAMFGKHFHDTEIPAADRAVLFDEYAPGADPAGAQVADDELRQNAPFKSGRWTGPASDLRDQVTADKAVAFLTDRAPGLDTPFFLGVGVTKPHMNWWVPSEYYDLYDPAEIRAALRASLDDGSMIPGAKEYLDTSPMNLPSPEHARIAADFDKWADYIHGYLASVSYADARVGEVLDALAANPALAAETSIMLWSDHGFSLGDKDRWAKFTHWREATESPLVIVDPDAPAGGVANQLVSLVDIFPTILDMMGIDTPAGLDLSGESLTPILRDPGIVWTDTATGRGVTLTTIIGSFSVRADLPGLGDMRYTRFPDGSEELYRLATDPREHDNLLDADASPSTAETRAAATMRGLMDDALHRAGVRVSAGAGVTGTAADEMLVAMHRPGKHVLDGGDGDDTYVLYRPGKIVEHAGGGVDNVYVVGDIGGDVFLLPDNVEMASVARGGYGGPGANVIVTRQGGTLKGFGGPDTLSVKSGASTLAGGKGADRLTGGDAADELFGGRGADILDGGAGDDRLIGGAGIDRMTGGAGADVFDFDDAGHSTRAAPDLILDFQGAGAAGGDLIDLSTIDANALSPGRQSFAFGSTGTGGLWILRDGARAEVLGNLDADPDPEFRILVEADGALGRLALQDFVL